MDEQTPPTPQPGHVYDVRAVAAMLGLQPATLRWHIAKGTPGIPAPDMKVGNAWAWRGENLDVAQINAARPKRGEHLLRGRPKRDSSPAPRTAPVDRPADAPDHGAAGPVARPADDLQGGWWDSDD